MPRGHLVTHQYVGVASNRRGKLGSSALPTKYLAPDYSASSINQRRNARHRRGLQLPRPGIRAGRATVVSTLL
jgi:hypothetical protein